MRTFLLFCLFILLSLSAFTQPLAKDANTIFLLNFENTLSGADGEMPLQSRNISYKDGKHGKAISFGPNSWLTYSTTNNINTKEGTIELWCKLDTNIVSNFFDMTTGPGGMRIGPHGNLFMDVNMGTSNIEDVALRNPITYNEWTHVAFTWDEKSIRIYHNGLMVANKFLKNKLINTTASFFTLFSDNNGNKPLKGLFDDLRISNKARTATEIFNSYLQGNNITITNLKLTDTTSIDLYKTWKIYMNNPGWWKTPQLFTASGKKIDVPNALINWEVKDTTIVKLINGDLEALNYGSTELIGKFQNMEFKIPVNVLRPFKEPEFLSEIDNFLLTPAPCHQKLIPVVMIAYFPTKDGIHLDKTEVDQWFFEDLTLLSDAKKRVISIAKDSKFMLEEGSKFRGYSNKDAAPYIGYKVIDIIFIYEPIARNRREDLSNICTLYNLLLEPYNLINRINGANYVNNLGVKEFWLFQVGNKTIYAPESNMSSPKTGDISNSRRHDDLPIFNHTYVLYGYNYGRVGNEAVHNHGHQIEAMLSHANWLKDRNTDLFWKNYVGRGPNNERPLGRCGDTHHPPNATRDYDYHNTRLIESDIMDWIPTGGKKTPVNKETWEKFNYNWIKNVYFDRFGKSWDKEFIHAESFWYVTWMQSLPGFGNQIAYNPPTNLRSSNDNSYDFEICSHACDHKGHFGFKRNTIKVTPTISENIHNKQGESGSRNSKFLINWMDIVYDWDNFYNKGLYADKPQPAAPMCKLLSTTLTIAPETCGEKNSIIDIPIMVKNCKDIAGLQLKIKSFKNEIAEVVGVNNIHPNSGLSSVDFAVVDRNLVLTYADAAKSIADDAPLFYVRVKLLGDVDSRVSIIFDGDIFALDKNGSKFRINLEAGTACIKVLTSSVSGTVTNISNKGLNNVQLEVKSGDTSTDTTKTDSTGSYILPILFNNKAYNIFPTFVESISKGIDISDLFLLRRHIQGVSLFTSPYTYVAADMNRDKNVDISDLFILRRIMQGLIAELPDKVPAWRFVPKAYSFPTTGNPLAETIPDALNFNPLTENKVNQDFIGVKYGDLDHSAVPFNDKFTENRSAADMELNIQGLTAASGNNITVEVKCKNFNKGAVMQFSLQWPTDKLQLLNVPSGEDIAIKGTTGLDQTLLSSGKLGFIWEADDFGGGTTLSDNSVVYELRFKILGTNNNTASVQNSITPKNAKFLDVNGSEILVKINSGTISIALPSSAIDQNYDKNVSIYPNPTNGIILFEADGQEVKNIEIRSLDGKLMLYVPELKDNSIDASHLMPGIYQLKGYASHVPFVRKVIIVK